MAFYVDLQRFQTEVDSILSHPVQTGKVMLYGSSFFARWRYERAHDQLAAASEGKLDVINHGFGGATIDELLYYYDRLVKPYAPKVMVFRTGYNELSKGMTPEAAVIMLERLLAWASQDNPGVNLLVMKVFECRHASDELHEQICIYNALLEERLSGWENVQLLDLNPFFYHDPADIGTRQNFRDVFVQDGLHLTDAAYEEMAQFFACQVLNRL